MDSLVALQKVPQVGGSGERQGEYAHPLLTSAVGTGCGHPLWTAVAWDVGLGMLAPVGGRDGAGWDGQGSVVE